MKKLFFVLHLLLTVSLVSASDDKGSGGGKANPATGSEAAVMEITGRVVDQNTGEALTGVRVSLEGTEVRVYTDFDGRFRFENLTPGMYNLSATYVSYNRNLVEKIHPVKEATPVEIKLTSSR